jgi:ABC-type transport system involved in cytochrome c biogenesis permease subunit
VHRLSAEHSSTAQAGQRFDLNTFARVPISYEGRVMPLDTLARTSLKIISGKSQLRLDDGKSVPAIQWLDEAFADAPPWHDYKVFRIDHPDLLSLLGLDEKRKLFSYDEVVAKADTINPQLERARAAKNAKRATLFQKSVADLGDHAILATRLMDMSTLYGAPPFDGKTDWQTFGEADAEASAAPGARPNPGVAAFRVMRQGYAINNPDLFNAASHDYLEYLHGVMPAVVRKAKLEYAFNTIEPFYHAMILYVLVFVLICASWLIAPARPTLQRTAFWVLVLTLLFHTAGLALRIYLSGRPPVTNLYSSAIFIGWAATVFCVALEKIYKNGIGSLAASIVAFPSLIIAHYLAASGDTMQMLQAVLDTNIWLATHVVVITLGYSATFLAGILGCIYVVGGVMTPSLSDDSSRKSLARMIYGVVCFAMLFSFVGTILGGIWADQSWGRFWGWDPKENGAVLIVLWNAIVPHARWGGVARERGVACLAIFGNVVTAWSWFGTNMLGVGLHSYGFMDSAVFWLAAFITSQLAIITIGCLPMAWWRSMEGTATAFPSR